MKRKRNDTTRKPATRADILRKLSLSLDKMPDPKRRLWVELLEAALRLRTVRPGAGNGMHFVDGRRVPVSVRIDVANGELHCVQVGEAEDDLYPTAAAEIIRRHREREGGT